MDPLIARAVLGGPVRGRWRGGWRRRDPQPARGSRPRAAPACAGGLMRRRSSRVFGPGRSRTTRCSRGTRRSTAYAGATIGWTRRTGRTRSPRAEAQALIDAVLGRYDIAHRWYRLKARLLGLDRLADYDVMAPIGPVERRYQLRARRGSSCSTAMARSRRGRGRSSRASSMRAGSTRRRGRRNSSPRSANPRPRRSTRTSCSTTKAVSAT